MKGKRKHASMQETRIIDCEEYAKHTESPSSAFEHCLLLVHFHHIVGIPKLYICSNCKRIKAAVKADSFGTGYIITVGSLIAGMNRIFRNQLRNGTPDSIQDASLITFEVRQIVK